MNADRLLIHAIEALHDGNRTLAGVALARLVRTDPTNAYAWLWLSRAVDEPRRQRYCIQRMLALDPTSKDALDELAILEQMACPTGAAIETAIATDSVFSVHLYVASIPHEGGADIVRRLHLRQPILLRREADNPYDRNAVRLETTAGDIFGFVPDEASRLLAPYMDQQRSELPGVVNELFTSSRGEHIRAGITLFLPAEESDLHAALNRLQNAKVEIAYWFEEANDTIDLMLDCTEDVFQAIRDWFGQCGLDILQYGTPFRYASDGCNYPWFVRFSPQQANQRQIKRHLEGQYRIRPTAAELVELNELFALSDFESERRQTDLKVAGEKIAWLNQELDRLKTASLAHRGVELEQLYPAICENMAERLSPEQVLRLLARLFSDHVVVLDSAYDSAREIERFRNSRRLFELLWRLSTKYPMLMLSGNGHRAACEDLFGRDAYASRDDESTTYLRNLRLFRYQQEDVYMPEHLKIGVATDETQTLRIHFKWLADEEKVIIGHCGKHLLQQA